MVNRVELIGNLTADPELRYTPSGVPYCYVRVATNRTTRSGEHADFHFAVAWHALAERTAEFLRLGDRVYVEGRLENNSFVDKDGKPIERSRIAANRILAMERFKERRIRTGPDADHSSQPERPAEIVSTAHQAHEPEVRVPVEDQA